MTTTTHTKPTHALLDDETRRVRAEQALAYIRKCAEDEGPETYADSAEIFAAIFGRQPDDDDGDAASLWSQACAAAAAHSDPRVRGKAEVYGDARVDGDRPVVDATRPPPPKGAFVSVDGRGRYLVLGHELGGDAVVLCTPGEPAKTWTIYTRRVQVRL